MILNNVLLVSGQNSGDFRKTDQDEVDQKFSPDVL